MEIRSRTVSVRSTRDNRDLKNYANNSTVVDSRNGALYCQICDDLVWDPTLEELRLRKIGTGSFSGKAPIVGLGRVCNRS